ncbi:MAG TPA: DUF3307 domain-containing protein [Candidatus Omnitrophota bacterium]|nr:DUF3307 domain-containing protein [Candidatus Omnitrophota bacterium]HRZ14435.1 DUF3307 domain-containing protein [Candidatus Omnitrophota bacterium]
MFLFIRLVLAHFLGDFPFQFDTIYKLKFQGIKGIIPHVLIIAGCSLLLSWPYLNLPLMWVFIAFVTAVHLIEDSIKLNFGTKKFSFWAYIVDQLVHVGTIALLLLTDLKHLPPPANQENVLVRIYTNNHLMLFIIALIVATYNGHFLIRCFKDTFFTRVNQCYMHEKWFGMVERGMIVALFFARVPLLILLAVSLLLRPLAYRLLKKPLSLHSCFISRADTALSWTVGMLTGIALWLLQTHYPVY